ncbi:MAG: Anthranilate phosphoribosyltransferase [Euryarchaeota archaeon ADurb.Bin165]|nr:MAG: Anthranilate phosphoribosyltransferase [Euryarchaeota archaeon ADurb.Bin165]
MMIQDTIKKVVGMQDLQADEAGYLMTSIADGNLTDAQIGAILTAFSMKGVTAYEITAFAHVLRDRAIQVKTPDSGTFVDTCGTGGDGAQTFNISTASALVAAAAGVKVVKHGNRGVSSRSGSADVLEALGIPVTLAPEEAAASVLANNIAFLFAPGYHPAIGRVAIARREIGFFSVFNILGPLLNPAGAQARLIGVGDKKHIHAITGALTDLGVSHAMVVHGDGTDEITITGETLVYELHHGTICRYTLKPEEFGIIPSPREAIAGGSPEDNAKIILDVFSGMKGPCRDIVLLNSAAAIYLGEKAACIYDGFKKARDVIDSGQALRLVESLRGNT